MGFIAGSNFWIVELKPSEAKAKRERDAFLLSISEHDSIKLSVIDQYDRIRAIRVKLGVENYLRRQNEPQKYCVDDSKYKTKDKKVISFKAAPWAEREVY